MMDLRKELELKQQKLNELAKQKAIQEGLPHIYPPHKLYKWQREFLEYTGPMALLCACNQEGKSSIQIMKCITWATDKNMWDKLWSPKLAASSDKMFWYYYPDFDTIEVEFQTKWKKYLPTGKFKEDPTSPWAWEEVRRKGDLFCLNFKNGIPIYFKTYGQKESSGQAGTVYAMFCDEEIPEPRYGELKARISKTFGQFHLVYTPTRGEDLWYRAMELQGTDMEAFPEAKKWHITKYDCLYYEDGSRNYDLTEEKINQLINSYGTEAEVQLRVFGRAVAASGRIFESFSIKRNVIMPRDVPHDWRIFAGIDYGSGGVNHKSAIVFVAIRPDYKKAYLFMSWRGDNMETPPDVVLEQYMRMKGKLHVIAAFYDYHATDLGTIALRAGIPLVKAEKSHNIGEGLLNTLFKNQMLDIFDTSENRKLMVELSTLRLDTPKNKAKDDLADATRYSVSKINFDFTGINTDSIIKVKSQESPSEQELRRRSYRKRQVEYDSRVEEELAEANELYGD